MKIARDGYLFVLPGIILLAVLVIARYLSNQDYLLYPIAASGLYIVFILFFSQLKYYNNQPLYIF